jgi:hypothetical protein
MKILPNDRLVIEVRDDMIVITRAPDLFEFKGFLGKAIPEGQERERMRRAAAAHVKGRGGRSCHLQPKAL